MTTSRRVLDLITLDPTGRGQLPTDTKLWHIVGGEPVDADSHLPILDPMGTGAEVVWMMPHASDGIVDQAIGHASQYRCGTGSVWSIEQRATTFRRAAALIRDTYWERFVGIIQACFQKSKSEAEGELNIICNSLDSLNAHRIRLLMGYTDGGQGYGYCTTSHAAFIPRGVVSGIWPWNYPVEIEMLQFIYALACENVVISKPHEYTGLASLAIREVLVEAGMPGAFYSIVQGFGPDCQQLITDPRVQQSVFTGSAGVAHHLSQLRPDLLIEDAGLNWIWMEPMWPGADINLAATGIAKSFMGLTGQRCSCCRFLFVPQEWLDAGLKDAIIAHTANYKWADRTMPPLMSWTTEGLLSRFEEMVGLGFKQLHGGLAVPEHMFQRPTDALAGRFQFGAVTPAIFEVAPSMLGADANSNLGKALLQERFASNLVVVPYGSDAERQMCMDFIHTLPHRLTCGIGTNDALAWMRLRHELPLNGVVNVGPGPWTTGAEGYKRFGTVRGNAASIGGSDNDVRGVWASRIGIHTSFPGY